MELEVVITLAPESHDIIINTTNSFNTCCYHCERDHYYIPSTPSLHFDYLFHNYYPTGAFHWNLVFSSFSFFFLWCSCVELLDGNETFSPLGSIMCLGFVS